MRLLVERSLLMPNETQAGEYEALYSGEGPVGEELPGSGELQLGSVLQ